MLPIGIYTKGADEKTELISPDEARARMGEIIRALAWAAQAIPGGFDVLEVLGIAHDRNLPQSKRIRTHAKREVCGGSPPAVAGGAERETESTLPGVHTVDQNRKQPPILSGILSWSYHVLSQIGS